MNNTPQIFWASDNEPPKQIFDVVPGDSTSFYHALLAVEAWNPVAFKEVDGECVSIYPSSKPFSDYKYQVNSRVIYKGRKIDESYCTG